MINLRTRKTADKYKKHIANGFLANGCNLCKNNKDELIKEFKHWRIVDNIFPWDRITKIHHMIIPKRHIKGIDLTKTEISELESIKSKYINKKYQIIAEPVRKYKSIPEHFHLHLIVIKDNI
jgi:diadenosine tetraphosphate (Ap4A) HIT family hydrolase